MDVACNTYSLRDLQRRDALATLRRLDFRVAELWAGHANYLSLGLAARRVAVEAAECGVRLGAYCLGGLFGLRPAVVDDRLARAFAFAREMGVDLVTGIVDPEVLPQVDARARRQGVRFAVENHWYVALARPRDLYAALAECSPAIGVTLDTGHLAYRGCDLTAAARLLGARTLHVHLKVVRRVPAVVRRYRQWRRRFHMEPALPGPDDGFDGFVVALRDEGYDGLLAVEHEAAGVPAGDLQRYRARALDLVRAVPLSEAAHA